MHDTIYFYRLFFFVFAHGIRADRTYSIIIIDNVHKKIQPVPYVMEQFGCAIVWLPIHDGAQPMVTIQIFLNRCITHLRISFELFCRVYFKSRYFLCRSIFLLAFSIIAFRKQEINNGECKESELSAQDFLWLYQRGWNLHALGYTVTYTNYNHAAGSIVV
jgi:hypothetical protein